MNKQFKLSCLIILFYTCCIANKSFAHEGGYGDDLQYKIEEINLDRKKQLLIPKKINKGEHHFYGYIGLDSGYETNPEHAEKETSSEDLDDSYFIARTQLTHSTDLKDTMSWTTSLNFAYRHYTERDNLSDDFLKIESGPSFYFQNIKTAFSIRPIYYFSQKHKKTHYYSDYPGAIIKFNYSGVRNLNVIGSYEYEAKNYSTEDSAESDADIHKILFRLRYKFGNNIFNIYPSYRRYNTKIDYLNKDIYSVGLGYIHFFGRGLYSGLYYEMIESIYDEAYIGDTKRRDDVENYYTFLLGYEFKDNWIFEGAFTREKIHSNLDSISTTHNNVFKLSIIYRFHIHKQR